MTNVAELSDYFVWATVTAYTIAMVCFAFDLAKVSDAVGLRRREKLEAGTAAAPATASAVNEAVRASKTGGVALAGETDPHITYVGRRSKALGIAMATTWVGLFLHFAAVITRGIAAGRVPWANMYEFTITGTLAAVVVFLGVQLFKEIRYVGVFVTFLVVTFLMVALQAFHLQADAVQPALQRYWLVIHVGVAVGATGVLTVAFVVSVLQLLRGAKNDGKLNWGWLDVLPTPDKLEALSFRINAWGFVMWTFTIIGGAIWADEAWGRAWGWDPKETWSFVIWVVYAAYLHARTTRGWAGRRAAWFVVVGYICVLMNFTVVNYVFSGLHSYAG
ncbi:c-type cytochrome biogenesis protein CcsB [Populibacterium corticicola]|jgi:cytochrome c-type biogenesis protein CcsB|uniref:C-type cytochrome biogenesis protein CcsB n=1 Tax=Populibacterium corticicola TaxID=1812826 RepID=A0ABW5XHE8_9MICO